MAIRPSRLKSPVRFPAKVMFNSDVEGVITDDSDVTPESIVAIVSLPTRTSLVKSRRAYSFGPRSRGAPHTAKTVSSSRSGK